MLGAPLHLNQLLFTWMKRTQHIQTHPVISVWLSSHREAQMFLIVCRVGPYRSGSSVYQYMSSCLSLYECLSNCCSPLTAVTCCLFMLITSSSDYLCTLHYHLGTIVASPILSYTKSCNSCTPPYTVYGSCMQCRNSWNAPTWLAEPDWLITATAHPRIHRYTLCSSSSSCSNRKFHLLSCFSSIFNYSFLSVSSLSMLYCSHLLFYSR